MYSHPASSPNSSELSRSGPRSSVTAKNARDVSSPTEQERTSSSQAGREQNQIHEHERTSLEPNEITHNVTHRSTLSYRGRARRVSESSPSVHTSPDIADEGEDADDERRRQRRKSRNPEASTARQRRAHGTDRRVYVYMYMCKRDDAVVRGPTCGKREEKDKRKRGGIEGEGDSEGRLEQQATKPSTWGKKRCTAGQRQTCDRQVGAREGDGEAREIAGAVASRISNTLGGTRNTRRGNQSREQI